MSNFSKETTDLLIAEASIFGVDAMITRQEAMGQSNLVNSTALPIERADSWGVLQRWGFQKQGKVDDLFCNATMPAGWQKVATSHSMWSNILDDRGLIRASIFYKAAFYDRDAFINASQSRFYVSQDYGYENLIAFKVTDKGTEKVVKRFCGGQYAVLDGAIGFLFEGQFYSQATSEYSDARFCGTTKAGALATQITMDEFYKQWHHVERRHDLINAAKNLASEAADRFVASIPDDDSQWSAAFDFPEAA